LINDLIQKNYDVYTIAKYDGYEEKVLSNNVFINNLNISLNKQNIAKDLLTLVDLIYKIYKIKPDLCLIYTIKPNIYASFAAQINKKKYVNVITGLGTAFINKSFTFSLIRFLYKLALRKSNLVIFQNQEDQAEFNKLNIKIPNSLIVQGSGVDTQKYDKNKLDTVAKEKFVFLFVGRLIKEKGIIEYINAANKFIKKNLKVEFWIVGDYDKNNPAAINKKHIDHIQNNRVFKYFGFQENVEVIVNSCDCLVLPSYREGLSRSILEAMALEKVVITNNVPGCNNLIAHKINGYLSVPRDENSLQNNMTEVYNMSKEDRINMGKLSRKLIIDNFSNEVINAQLLSLVNRIILN
tara:strand:+ start:1104 stop:2159 length:1056 start_codon:yes stop_codon:yes gene_type:complete